VRRGAGFRAARLGNGRNYVADAVAAVLGVVAVVLLVRRQLQR